MSIYNILSAIAVAALGAAAVTVLPGLSPDVEAGTSAPVSQTDRIEARSPASECSQLAWPYYDVACQHDRTQASGQARVVRIVSTDRLPR
jgi:hypothetical protein